MILPWLLGAVLGVAGDPSPGQFAICIDSGWPDTQCKVFDDMAKADAWAARKHAANVRAASKLDDRVYDIALALMRVYFIPPVPKPGQKSPLYCLTVLGKYPPQPLVKALAAARIRVAPGSSCHAGHGADEAALDIAFYRFQPLDHGRVRVGMSASGECAVACSSNQVYVMRQDGGGTWFVERTEDDVVY